MTRLYGKSNFEHVIFNRLVIFLIVIIMSKLKLYLLVFLTIILTTHSNSQTFIKVPENKITVETEIKIAKIANTNIVPRLPIVKDEQVKKY